MIWPLLHYIVVQHSKLLMPFSRQDSVGLSYSEVEHLISSLDEITDYLTQHLADLDNEVIIEINNNNNNSGVYKCVSLLINTITGDSKMHYNKTSYTTFRRNR